MVRMIATELLDGRVDVVIVTLLGAPVPAIQDVEAKEPVTFLNLAPEQIETIRKAMPELSPSKIPAGTSGALENDYVTVGVYNFAIGRANLPDDLAYQLVKADSENQPRLLKAHPTASETLPQNVDKNTFLPFRVRRGPLLPRDRNRYFRIRSFRRLILPSLEILVQPWPCPIYCSIAPTG